MAEYSNSLLRLFGFELKKIQDDKKEKAPSVVPPADGDGSEYITASGTRFGQHINLDGVDSKNILLVSSFNTPPRIAIFTASSIISKT